MEQCPHGTAKSHHSQKTIPGFGLCLTSTCKDCQRAQYRAVYASNRAHGHGTAWREFLPIVSRFERTPTRMFVTESEVVTTCTRCGAKAYSGHTITVETTIEQDSVGASRSVCAVCRDEFDAWWGRN